MDNPIESGAAAVKGLPPALKIGLAVIAVGGVIYVATRANKGSSAPGLTDPGTFPNWSQEAGNAAAISGQYASDPLAAARGQLELDKERALFQLDITGKANALSVAGARDLAAADFEALKRTTDYEIAAENTRATNSLDQSIRATSASLDAQARQRADQLAGDEKARLSDFAFWFTDMVPPSRQGGTIGGNRAVSRYELQAATEQKARLADTTAQNNEAIRIANKEYDLQVGLIKNQAEAQRRATGQGGNFFSQIGNAITGGIRDFIGSGGGTNPAALIPRDTSAATSRIGTPTTFPRNSGVTANTAPTIYAGPTITDRVNTPFYV